MHDSDRRPGWRGWAGKAALAVGGLLVGGVLVGTLTANAATSSTQSAAAAKAVGGGTAGAVTTDVSGNGHEVTVTKSDGSKVEVHLDQSFNLDDHGRLGG